MHVFEFALDELDEYIQAEVVFERTLTQGDDGTAVTRIQEWLTLHGYGLDIDGDYGPATARQVAAFQSEQMGIAPTDEVDQETFDALVAPMVDTLRQRLNSSIPFGDAVVEYANAHLTAHPVEVGGDNRGPWVRLYMKGNDGAVWRWCAGFVGFVFDQASESLQVDKPIEGSFSCDSVSAQGSAAGLFVAEADVDPGSITPGSIFLVRKSATDWTHVGLVTQAFAESFDTIEGNTNDDGSVNGFEVCARSRGYAGKDFIVTN